MLSSMEYVSTRGLICMSDTIALVSTSPNLVENAVKYDSKTKLFLSKDSVRHR